MIKPAIFTGAIILAVIAFGLFEIEYKVDSLRAQLNQVNTQLVADKEEIHVLKAEWSYLNQPDRIKDMSNKYLNLEVISAYQIADISEIKNMESSMAESRIKPSKTAALFKKD